MHRDRWISPIRTLPQSESLGNLTPRLAVSHQGLGLRPDLLTCSPQIY